ncbi:hypothetical protein QTP88_012309 [Uroleucon formosanum]
MIRSLIVGPSGCGKTNLIFTLLTHINGIRFHNVYIYSKTLDQPKYKLLSDILSDIAGIQLFTFFENEQVIEPEKALPNSVFIFEDIITENQKIARTYFSRGRHNLIDVFYLAQSYSKVPKQLLRDNANFIVLFKQDETNLKHVYMEHCSGDMSYPEFKDFCTSLLGELIKAKENIKRKYTALKHGKADIHSIVTETLKPIINPLNEIHKSTSQPREITVQNIEKKNNTENSRVFKINELLDSYSIDKTYGPKLQSNGDVYLGKKEIKLNENTLIIEDTSYPLTQGLVSLIISKSPKIYTTDDLNTYKRILIQTSAHLTSDEKKIKKGGNKFIDIIKPLFPSGNGLSVKLQKHNLVYWNNPNELVERLQLLLASQAAGNTGLSNEILSIYEELYEAGLIRRIPNV